MIGGLGVEADRTTKATAEAKPSNTNCFRMASPSWVQPWSRASLSCTWSDVIPEGCLTPPAAVKMGSGPLSLGGVKRGSGPIPAKPR